MRSEQLAVVAGWHDTRAAFTRWNNDVAGVVRTWMGTSLLVGIALLVATWVVGTWFASGSVATLDTFAGAADPRHAVGIFTNNLLVLAMHALICVAGYMATTTVAIAADDYAGWLRRVHLLARPVTFAFILVVTWSSFALQALTLGTAAPGVARAYDMEIWQLLLVVTPHAIPELVAVFLPLGAWLVIARRRAWNELFAASILATVVAVPLLAVAAIVEEYVTPLTIAAAFG